MTDREKLLELYKWINNIQIPKLTDQDLQYIPQNVKEGLDIILDWLKEKANNHFNK